MFDDCMAPVLHASEHIGTTIALEGDEQMKPWCFRITAMAATGRPLADTAVGLQPNPFILHIGRSEGYTIHLSDVLRRVLSDPFSISKE